MKKIILVLSLICVIGFVMLNFGNKTIVAKNGLDLIKISTALEGENILITEWSLHAREKVDNFQNVKEVIRYSDELKEKFPNWDWSIHSDSKQWKATATNQTTDGHRENIQILTTLTNKKLQTYIIYEAKSENNLNKGSEKELEKELSKRLSDIFRGNATIFSCIKGEFNDKINKSLPSTVKKLLNNFKATEIEALKEDSFISTSAYSPLFADTITSNEKDINLQLGIRTQGLGGKTTIVVGTPIITIEY